MTQSPPSDSSPADSSPLAERHAGPPGPVLPLTPRRFWADMTTVEFARLDVARAIAVLPVAAIESHGPHLDVSVDATINAGILARALELMPDTLPVTILPPQPVGKSDEHGRFPGTLSLRPETVTGLWLDIGESVARAGLRKLVIFNSHGGQPQIADIVAGQLRARHGMLAVTCNWWRLVDASDLFDAGEIAQGIHGGAIETSMMLHLAPARVRVERIADFPSMAADLAARFKWLHPHGRIGFGWQIQDLNPDGACGDATQADADKGRVLVERAARNLVELLEEIHQLDAVADGG